MNNLYDANVYTVRHHIIYFIILNNILHQHLIFTSYINSVYQYLHFVLFYMKMLTLFQCSSVYI